MMVLGLISLTVILEEVSVVDKRERCCLMINYRRSLSREIVPQRRQGLVVENQDHQDTHAKPRSDTGGLMRSSQVINSL